jgi:hypothetical protein
MCAWSSDRFVAIRIQTPCTRTYIMHARHTFDTIANSFNFQHARVRACNRPSWLRDEGVGRAHTTRTVGGLQTYPRNIVRHPTLRVDGIHPIVIDMYVNPVDLKGHVNHNGRRHPSHCRFVTPPPSS